METVTNSPRVTCSGLLSHWSLIKRLPGPVGLSTLFNASSPSQASVRPRPEQAVHSQARSIAVIGSVVVELSAVVVVVIHSVSQRAESGERTPV